MLFHLGFLGSLGSVRRDRWGSLPAFLQFCVSITPFSSTRCLPILTSLVPDASTHAAAEPMASALSQELDGWLLLRDLLRQINPYTSNLPTAILTTSKMRPHNTAPTLSTMATLVRKAHHHSSKALSYSSLRMRTVPMDMRRLLARRPPATRTKLCASFQSLMNMALNIFRYCMSLDKYAGS